MKLKQMTINELSQALQKGCHATVKMQVVSIGQDKITVRAPGSLECVTIQLCDVEIIEEADGNVIFDRENKH